MENSTKLHSTDSIGDKEMSIRKRGVLKYFIVGLFFLGLIGIYLQILEVMDSHFLALWVIGWFVVTIPTIFLVLPKFVEEAPEEDQTLKKIHTTLYIIYIGICITFLGSTFLQGCLCSFTGAPVGLFICLMLLVKYHRKAVQKKIYDHQPLPSTLVRDTVIGLVVLGYSLLTAFGVPWYLAGRLNVGTFILSPFLPWIEAGWIMLISLLLLRIGGDWKEIDPRLRKIRTLILLLNIILLGIGFYCCPSSSRIYLLGFREWVRKNVDIPNIQAWMKTVKYDTETSARIETLQWPVEVKMVKPEAVYSNPDRTLKLIWGWREFYYGVTVFQAGTHVVVPSKAVPTDGAYVWLQ